jgi:hypothetical protein
VDSCWLRQLGKTWADDWFAGLGQYNHIGRQNNAILGLRITADEFIIRFNSGQAAEARFPLSAELSAAGPQATYYVSADLAPVIYRLSQTAPLGVVTLLGNQHAFVCEYETATGSFRIAVPTCDNAGQRDDFLFERVPA